MDDATLAALRTAASAVFDVGFATMVGALAVRALLHDATSDWALRCARRCRRLLLRACAVALAGSLAWMAVEAISMTDAPLPQALGAIADIVVDTPFGLAWAAATGALAVSLVLVAMSLRHAPPLRTLAVAMAVVAVAHASAGHAGANGLGVLALVMSAHELATAAWAGGVVATVVCVLRGDVHSGDAARVAGRLSTLATAALAVVVLTGGASAWHGLGGSPAPLLASPWGLVLDAKLALVAAAIALGGFNRFVVMPALPHAWPRFARVLRVEAAVLLAALVAAAWLANGEPPAM
jgi:putative copper resistance protein D